MGAYVKIEELRKIPEESKNAVQSIREADTLIAGGTSQMVYSAAGLIDYCRGCHLVPINMTETKADTQEKFIIRDIIKSFSTTIDSI